MLDLLNVNTGNLFLDFRVDRGFFLCFRNCNICIHRKVIFFFSLNRGISLITKISTGIAITEPKPII